MQICLYGRVWTIRFRTDLFELQSRDVRTITDSNSSKNMDTERRQNLTHRRPSVVSDGASSRSSDDLTDGASIDFLAIGAHPQSQQTMRTNPSVSLQTGDAGNLDRGQITRQHQSDEERNILAGVDNPARILLGNEADDEDDDVIRLNIDDSLLGRVGEHQGYEYRRYFVSMIYRKYS